MWHEVLPLLIFLVELVRDKIDQNAGSNPRPTRKSSATPLLFLRKRGSALGDLDGGFKQAFPQESAASCLEIHDGQS